MERITIDSAICNSRPIIRGTRITAQTVVDFLSAGDSVDDVLEEYPALTRDEPHLGEYALGYCTGTKTFTVAMN